MWEKSGRGKVKSGRGKSQSALEIRVGCTTKHYTIKITNIRPSPLFLVKDSQTFFFFFEIKATAQILSKLKTVNVSRGDCD